MRFLDLIKEALNPQTVELFDDLYNNHYKALLFFLKASKVPKDLPFLEKKRIAENHDEILERYNSHIQKEREEKRKYLINRINKLANNYEDAFNLICQKEFQLTKEDFLTKSYPNDVYEQILSFENKIRNEHNRQITIKQNLLFFDDLCGCYSHYIELYIKYKFQKGAIDELTIDEKSELVENYQDIILYAVNKGEERQRYLEQKYPQGLKKYIEEESKLLVDNIYNTYEITDIHILKKIQFQDFTRGYTALKYLLISEEKISIYQQHYEEYKKERSWEEEHKKYVEFHKKLKDDYLGRWGGCKHDLGYYFADYQGVFFKRDYFVWQFFPHFFCLEKGLDYSLFYLIQNQNTIFERIKGLQVHVEDYVNKIVNYTIALQIKLNEDILFILGNSDLVDDVAKTFNDFYFNKFKKELLSKGIFKKEHFIHESEFVSMCGIDINRSFKGKTFFVIEMITTNSHLKQLCSLIRDNVIGCSNIVYISYTKEFNRNEMIERINLLKRKVEELKKKRGEEKKIEIGILRKQFEDEESSRQEEAERIRIETEYQIQAQIKEEERIKKEEAERAQLEFEAQYGIKRNIKPHSFLSDDYKKIYSCISHWNTLAGTLKYFYFYNYYPYNLDKVYGFQPTAREQNVRKLVWNFKNNKEKGITELQHQNALKFIIPLMKRFLYKTFGDTLAGITLVCIPASTKRMNEDRYKEFSSILCNELGMINAYDYIKIGRDREARHEGGVNIQAEILFDESFFMNKNILIFDDVITRGDSMIAFYRKMTCLGANVICGLAIGKTKHERIDDDPIISLIQS